MKNKYEIRGDVAAIFCWAKGERYETFIDMEKLFMVNAKPNTWLVNIHRGNAVSHGQSIEGTRVQTYLHRLVTGAPDGLVVDHIDGNPLMNCNFNLRVVTQKENLQNLVQDRTNNTSGFRGVSYAKDRDKWEAYYWTNYYKNLVGYFNTAEEANEAVTIARSRHMPYSPDAREAA